MARIMRPSEFDDMLDSIFSLDSLDCIDQISEKSSLKDSIIKEIKVLRTVFVGIENEPTESICGKDHHQFWLFFEAESRASSCTDQVTVCSIKHISYVYEQLKRLVNRSNNVGNGSRSESIFTESNNLADVHSYIVKMRKLLEKEIVGACISAWEMLLFGISMQSLWNLLNCRLNILSSKKEQIKLDEEKLKFLALIISFDLKETEKHMESQAISPLLRNNLDTFRYCSYLFALAEMSYDVRDAINCEAFGLLQKINPVERSHFLKCVDHLLKMFDVQPMSKHQISVLLKEVKIFGKLTTISQSTDMRINILVAKLIRATSTELLGYFQRRVTSMELLGYFQTRFGGNFCFIGNNDGAGELNFIAAELIEALRLVRMQTRCFKVSATDVIDGILCITNLSDKIGILLQRRKYLGKGAVKRLLHEMEFLRSFLKTKHLIDNIAQYDVIYSCINLAYDVEAIIDTCLVENGGPSCKSMQSLLCILEQAIDIKSEIKSRFAEGMLCHQLVSQAANSRKFDSMHVSKDAASSGSYLSLHNTIVGFGEESIKLMEKIKQELPDKKDDVISVIGMPGVGKTTLLRKLYNHELLVDTFDVRLWCIVSQDYNKRQVLIQLLGQLTRPSNRHDEMDDGDLALVIYQELSGKKFLVVLDDVWTISTWDEIIVLFPMQNKGSRILVTSRDKTVAEHAKIHSEPYHLSLRSNEQSWVLLKAVVFQNHCCPYELEEVGWQIAIKCQGLPLTIVLVAGILINSEKSREAWQEICNSLKFKTSVDVYEYRMSAVEHSYKNLPEHLQVCFLYLAAFPEDQEISVVQLLRLWMAERFVALSDQVPLIANMAEAEACLSNLTSRNLLIPFKYGPDKTLKTILVHDLIHEFCLSKSNEGHFLCCLHSDHPHPDCHRRRACTNNYRLINNKIDNSSRTMIIYHGKAGLIGRIDTAQYYYLQTIVNHTKLIRVLDIMGLEINCESLDLFFHLTHLRYLAIYRVKAGCSIGSSIGNLQNLETLVLRSALNINVSNEIWGIVNLRHLHVNCVVPLRQLAHISSTLVNLESFSFPTLQSWNSFYCFFNLREFKCYLSANHFGTICKSKKLCKLEHLKIIGPNHASSLEDNSYDIDLEGYRTVFKAIKYRLRKLTLSFFRLPWSELSHIGKFPELVVLKLSTRSFDGETWETGSGNFPCLKYLKLEEVRLGCWDVNEESFSMLEYLVLKKCEDLKEIPFEFANIITLERIDVHGCYCSVGDSALKIKEELLDNGIEGCNVVVSSPSDHYLNYDWKYMN